MQRGPAQIASTFHPFVTKNYSIKCFEYCTDESENPYTCLKSNEWVHIVVYCLAVRRQEILNILHCNNNNYTNKLLLPFTGKRRGEGFNGNHNTTRFLIHTCDHHDQISIEGVLSWEIPIRHRP